MQLSLTLSPSRQAAANSPTGMQSSVPRTLTEKEKEPERGLARLAAATLSITLYVPDNHSLITGVPA
jgi:hypothetical protein